MVDSGSFRRRSRRELDAIADAGPDGSPLGDFVLEMRSFGDGDGVEPNRALTEFVSAPSRGHDVTAAAVAAESEVRNPMISQLSTLAATTLGKVVLTGGVAAAAVGGAAVVNEIQEPAPVEVIAAADDSDSSRSLSLSSSSTSNSTASTSTTAFDSSTSMAATIPSMAAVVDTDPITIDADGAGTVTYQIVGGQPVLINAIPADGFTLRDETTAFEIDLSFRNPGGSERVDVEIEIDDGEPRVRIERDTDSGSDSYDDDSDDYDDDSDDYGDGYYDDDDSDDYEEDDEDEDNEDDDDDDDSDDD